MDRVIFLLLAIFASVSIYIDGHGYGRGHGGHGDGYLNLPPSNVTIFCLLNGGACATPGECGHVSIFHGGLTKPAYRGGKLLLCNHTTICCLPGSHFGYGYKVVGFLKPAGKPYKKRARKSRGKGRRGSGHKW